MGGGEGEWFSVDVDPETNRDISVLFPGSDQDPQPTHPVQSLITFFLCGWFITGQHYLWEATLIFVK
jgi:hypothetical protein